MVLNSQHAPLIIVSYSSAWPSEFQSECEALEGVFRPVSFRIEHIGSTSVAGLCAKPIIDVMLGATSLREIETLIPDLTQLGYEYMPQHEQVMPERRFFAKPVVRPRHFHLHAVVLGGSFWRERLIFRDALRANSRLCREYAQLKQRLAIEFGDDREGYTNAKAPFIHAVLRNARKLRC